MLIQGNDLSIRNDMYDTLSQINGIFAYGGSGNSWNTYVADNNIHEMIGVGDGQPWSTVGGGYAGGGNVKTASAEALSPEAISYYSETDKPERERWNSLSGLWQLFALKGWYQAVVHGIFGVGAEAGGITFYPYDGEEMSFKGLHMLSRCFDIDMKGSGGFISEILSSIMASE